MGSGNSLYISYISRVLRQIISFETQIIDGESSGNILGLMVLCCRIFKVLCGKKRR